MKKIKYFILFVLLFPCFANADTISNISTDVNIKIDGSAQIVEKWDVKADSGTEWYKQMYNLGNMEISNFTVSMDGKPLTMKNWNVDESLESKSGYYGINYVSEGIELCFGKSDYNNHTFTLSYNLSNFVFNLSDAQAVYFTFLPKATVKKFDIEISSYYKMPDDLPVWGYGYKGYAYVQNGKIYMSGEGELKNDYVVLLAQFPLNTFNTANQSTLYNTFDEVLNKAEEGSYSYDYGNSSEDNTFIIVIMLLFFGFFIPAGLIQNFSKGSAVQKKYGYLNNKKIEDAPFYRDIPCNKDIFYANTLIYLNNFSYKESNILGAVILKWIKEDKIKFIHKTGAFNRNESVIDLTKNVIFEDEDEKDLYRMMFKASKDGMLEIHEFENWSKRNYSTFFQTLSKLKNKKINTLSLEGHIYPRNSKAECKQKMVMDDYVYEESVKLLGLKKFLEYFSSMKEKEAINVKIWDEYLMFAYLFGNAEKVAKQFKNLYPEIVNESNFDYDMVIYVHNISTRTTSAASSARSAAENYKSGGGGFSSGGGGGGSHGGGGSMGGR